MKKLLGKNWQTTLVGLLAAVYFAIEPVISGDAYTWQDIVKVALPAIFGYVAKSHNVTGVGEEAKTTNEIKKES